MLSKCRNALNVLQSAVEQIEGDVKTMLKDITRRRDSVLLPEMRCGRAEGLINNARIALENARNSVLRFTDDEITPDMRESLLNQRNLVVAKTDGILAMCREIRVIASAPLPSGIFILPGEELE